MPDPTLKIDSTTVLSKSGTTVSIDSGVTFPQFLASYLWDNWNPSDGTGTYTNASGTGTTDDSPYVTLANSSGTVTVTFDVAGKYSVTTSWHAIHAAGYTYDTLTIDFGGTATKRNSSNVSDWGDSEHDGNISASTNFYVSATATQTLTVLPKYRVAGASNAAQHTASCNMTVIYCGG